MLKKTELEVSIHCEGPFTSSIYRRLFRLNDSYRKHTVLPPLWVSIDSHEMQEEKIELQYVTYYDTLHTIRTLEIKRAKTLYSVFVSIIYESLIYLEEIGYDPLGDILVISAIPSEDHPNHYNFHWSFTD